MWDKNTYQFPNFNCATIEVWEWISNFIPHFYNGCNQLSVLGSKLIHFSKRGPRNLGHSWFRQWLVAWGPFYSRALTLIPACMNNYIHYNVWHDMLWSAGWNYFTILKLKWCSCWSLWIDKYFHHTLYWTYNYLSMLWFKLIWACDYLSMQGFKVNLGMWLLI